jgi:hypothetical protein
LTGACLSASEIQLIAGILSGSMSHGLPDMMPASGSAKRNRNACSDQIHKQPNEVCPYRYWQPVVVKEQGYPGMACVTARCA